MIVYLPRPASSGTVRLRSTNPRDHPIIDPNYLSEQSDIDTLADGMRMSYQVGNTKIMKERLNAKSYMTVYPGCEDKFYPQSSEPQVGVKEERKRRRDLFDIISPPKPELQNIQNLPDDLIPSNDYLACVAKLMTNSYKHPACTCRMGHENDVNAVVTPRLKVRNVKNLRIIDSSTLPQLVSGHLNAVTIMIGEKGSDLIKEDYQNA